MDTRNSNAAFPQTRWSIVAQLGGDRESDAGVALAALCENYWAPLYAFARHKGKNPADAEDLVQGFLAKIAANSYLEKADAEKGKFRNFLLTGFRRYTNDEFKKEQAQRRGGGKEIISFETGEVEEWFQEVGGEAASPEAAFDQQWALSIVENTMQRLAEDWDRKGKGNEFDALRLFLTDSGDNEEYQKIAGQVGLSLPNFKIKLHRLRAKFGEFLRETVTETLSDSEPVEDELRYFLDLL